MKNIGVSDKKLVTRKISYTWECPICNSHSRKPLPHYMASRNARMHGKREHDMIINPVFRKIENGGKLNVKF